MNKWSSCSRCAMKAMHTHLGVIPKMTRELLLRGNSDTEWLVRWTGSWTNTSVASRFQWKFYVDGRLSGESTSPFTTAQWCKVLISCCFKINQKKLLNKRWSSSRFTMNVVYSYFGGDTKNDQRIAPTEGQWESIQLSSQQPSDAKSWILFNLKKLLKQIDKNKESIKGSTS